MGSSKFNPDKTQLIRFRSQSTFMYHDRISLDGVDLKFSDTVMHLGHLLSYNLDDTPNIIRVTKDLNRKAILFCVLLNQLTLLLSVF